MLIAAINSLQIVELTAVGLAAGVIGGLFGIGGGILMIPGMVLLLGASFGPESLHIYKLASLISSIALSLPATVQHVRAKAVVKPILRATVPAALVGAVAGVALAQLFVGDATRVIQLVFGVFMIAVGLWDSFRSVVQSRTALTRAQCPLPARNRGMGAVIGLPSGLIAGFLGVGGGVWAVPAQNLLYGVRLQNSIANAACTIVLVAAVCVVAKTIALEVGAAVSPLHGWWLALWLAPGAMLGGWLGAALTHRIPLRRLRFAFNALLILTGVRMLAA